jgi:hypothetical protein
MSLYSNQKGQTFYGLDNSAKKLNYNYVGDNSSLGQAGLNKGLDRYKSNMKTSAIALGVATSIAGAALGGAGGVLAAGGGIGGSSALSFGLTGATIGATAGGALSTGLSIGDALGTKSQVMGSNDIKIKSGLGVDSLHVFDNSDRIAKKNAKESEQYVIKNKTAGEIKNILNINNLNQTEDFMTNKGETLNLITQDVKTKSWGRVKTSHFYWNETTDFNLARYGYETYYQKLQSFTESANWLKLDDLSKVNDNVLFAEVKDNKGQNEERLQRDSQMNNYNGEYAKSTT